jgi:hypothetical protein
MTHERGLNGAATAHTRPVSDFVDGVQPGIDLRAMLAGLAAATDAGTCAPADCQGCCGPEVADFASQAMLLFTSFLFLSFVGATIAIGGSMPPDPSVHWPGHAWIHFMKRLHVIMSIGCFLMNLCALFFSIFALHRTLAGGFDTRGRSAVELIVRELEFEYVAVSAYFFAGTMLLMGPVGIRCFCMVQQGLRSDTLAASVMCLIVGVVLLILSFFNQHLAHFPFVSYTQVGHGKARARSHPRSSLSLPLGCISATPTHSHFPTPFPPTLPTTTLTFTPPTPPPRWSAVSSSCPSSTASRATSRRSSCCSRGRCR